MKTTMEMYPGNRVEKLSKKQRRIKKSIATYARKLHASEVKIVFYWNEYLGYYAYAWQSAQMEQCKLAVQVCTITKFNK